MITVAPRLLGQSSSTPGAPRRPTGTSQPDGSQAGCVAPKHWYGEGEKVLIWTWKFATCLFSPSCGAA